jgi:hypothetical protein
MQSIHIRKPTRALVAVAIFAGALVAATLAISSWVGGDDPTILNTEKVEQAIEDSSLAQRGARADVVCPDGVHQKEGLEFNCTAAADGGSTRFVVTQLDDAGQVHYEAP